MELKLRIIIFAIVIITIIYQVMLVKDRKVYLKYILVWILVGVGIIIFIAYPDLIMFISKGLGIESPINAVFFIGSIFQLSIIFSLTVASSRQSMKIRELTQKIGLMEKATRDEFKLYSKISDKSNNF